MTKTKVAVLAKRASNSACFVVVVDDNVTNKTANYALTNLSRFICPRVFRFWQPRRNSKLFAIFIAANTAPTV